ncbi:choice-of-anchor D domain-containing protein [Stigmatella sp. ncwal1]|uniref:Choice-of-anchor D domain-containing protein n=1 Tax=Stigmatella ashevillensis TaxID=2995309 RepID=A0ABT5D0R7_9BACT|nr:choice-of-anchor D domain-containing protein [Stigmatella ashevillena]MDC0707260.1 choice-of-anchor D domain-containing protein [Stigmatella ashevillena]
MRQKRGFIACSMLGTLVAVTALAGETVPLGSLELVQQQRLLANDTTAYDLFGFSVSSHGDTLVVGAPYSHDADRGNASGAAYVFVRTGKTWSLQQKLLPADGAPGDLFGYSVALHGDTAVVGSPLDDDAGTDSGSGYVFVRRGTSWVQQQKLRPTASAPGDVFGHAVAIHGDTAVLGAPHDSGLGNRAGAAYVFARSGVNWTQEQKLTATDAAEDDRFGLSISLSETTVLIGAPYDDGSGNSSDTGSAYVFTNTGTGWRLQQKLSPQDALADSIAGFSVALSNNTAVLGAPFRSDKAVGPGSALVFVRDGTTWTQQQKITAEAHTAGNLFGYAVALSGEQAVATAPGDDASAHNSGSVYRFSRSGSAWTQQQKVTVSASADNDRMGHAVALGTELLVVGAPGEDASGTDSGVVHIFVPVAKPGYDSTPAPGAEINAGNAHLGTSVTTPLVVRETGNATLEVTGYTLTGTHKAEFSVAPGTLTLPDGSAPQTLTVTCTPKGLATRTATLAVRHNAPGSPATYALTCKGLPARDPYADAVSPATSSLVLGANSAIGAPDGQAATVVGLLGSALVLDMGAGEEGTGDLKVYYLGLTLGVITQVDFLAADYSVISSGTLRMLELGLGIRTTTVTYSGVPKPYRFVRMRGVLTLPYQIDAIEAVSIVP